MVYASQNGYYKAIEESSELTDCSPFIDFMLGEILKILKQSTAESPFLTASEQNIIQFMRANASISASQLAEQCGMSARQIEKYIAELKKKGVLQREGARKNGKWKVLRPHI